MKLSAGNTWATAMTICAPTTARWSSAVLALDSDAEIIHYVAWTKGTIGCVSNDSPTPGVKLLAIARPGANSERQRVTRFEPEYPETLQRLLIGGTMRLVVAISQKRNVESVQLLGGNPVLAEPAIKAVKQWVCTAGPTMQEVSIKR